MKLSALIIAAFAALAPMQAYARTGSDQNSGSGSEGADPAPGRLGG
jgi:hypothetical protein